MKPTEKSTLPCAIFGHNYVPQEPRYKTTTNFSCKNCGKPLKYKENGDFAEDYFSNKEVLKVMRKLLHIKLKLAKSSANF